MKIGAYQFSVTNSIPLNMKHIQKAILQAAKQNVKLLVFPECALTGYPPRDIDSSASVNFDQLAAAYGNLQEIAGKTGISLILGTILKDKDEEQFYNTALVFLHNRKRYFYYKKALWGWDRDNFSLKNSTGIFGIDNWRIGIRICFEVRFPEFFRELYREHTDLNIILFYDVSNHEDTERYEIIKSHILTRAVENTTYTLSVNTSGPFQTAPTLLCDRSGHILYELVKNQDKLLVYEIEKTPYTFGEQGRKYISDSLLS